MQGKKISKEELLSGIKEARKKGVDLRVTTIQKSIYRRLYRCYKNHFKSWPEALAAAGINYESLENEVKEKDRLSYLEDLKKAYATGLDLSRANLVGTKESDLYYRHQRFYSGRFSYEQALEDADLPVTEIVRQKRHDKNQIAEELKDRYKNGLAINSTALPEDLYKGCTNHFGSLDAALKYAGFNPQKIRKTQSHSTAEILLEIVKLHLKGKNLNEKFLIKHGTKKIKRIVYAAQKKFTGRWPEAVRTLGIDYSIYEVNQKWNKEKVYKSIQALSAQGEPLNGGYIGINHSDLYHAADRYAGGWEKAITDSGLSYEQINLGGISLSPDEIISQIKNLYDQGESLSAGVMMVHPKDCVRRVYTQALSKFGSWSAAITAAGLLYNDIAKVEMHSIKSLRTKIKLLDKAGVSLTPSDLMGTENHKYYHAVMRRRDTWKEFLLECKIDYQKHLKQIGWKNGQGVLEYLKNNFTSGLVTGAGNDKNFRAAAEKYFGSIPTAVKKAGLIYSRQGKISKKMLNDPMTISALYQYNLEFLKQIAQKIYWGAKTRKLKTYPIEDLISEAFMELITIIPEKPADKGVKQFAYWKIYERLAELNRQLGKEVSWDNEVYFDLFKKDEDEENE